MSAVADAGCSKYASPTGNDANSGDTPAQAVASPFVLLAKLTAGQTGCLQDGANFVLGGGDAITAAAGTTGSPITLRPITPGARATITTATGFWIQGASHDLDLRDLDIRRSGATGGSLMLVDGDRISMTGMDLTYPANICLDVGEDSRNGSTNPAEDFTFSRSRVHDCGSSYGPPSTANDSGVHGIYLQYIRDGADADPYGAVLEDNYVYRNHNRGIQLYPDVTGALIQHNVLYGNGANLNLGSEAGAGVYSRDNTITANVIAESTLDGLSPGGFVGDYVEVLGNFPQDASVNNHVDGNCISNTQHPGALYDGYGFTHVNNIENQPPIFVDAAQGDFTQTAASPCQAMGARLPTPTTLAIEDVTSIEGTGAAVNMRFTVTRFGPTTGTSSATVSDIAGTAANPDDYTLGSTSVSFAPGATTAFVDVSVVPDAVVEIGETFTLTLASASGATLARSSAQGTILNDDQPPAVPPPNPTGTTTPAQGFGVDEQIRRMPHAKFTGTGPGGTVAIRLKRGETYAYKVRVLNTGKVADSFAMAGTSSKHGISITYRQGKTDRTKSFVAGTATTGPLAVKASRFYIVTVSVGKKATTGSKRSFYIKAVSSGASQVHQDAHDRIRLRVVVS